VRLGTGRGWWAIRERIPNGACILRAVPSWTSGHQWCCEGPGSWSLKGHSSVLELSALLPGSGWALFGTRAGGAFGAHEQPKECINAHRGPVLGYVLEARAENGASKASAPRSRCERSKPSKGGAAGARREAGLAGDGGLLVLRKKSGRPSARRTGAGKGT